MDVYVFACLCFGALILMLTLKASSSRWTRIAAVPFIVFATTIAISSGTTRYLGNELVWYQTTPWKEVLLFVSMILGMCTRSFADLIDDRRAKRKLHPNRRAKLRFDWLEFIYPLLFSAITFGVVLSATEETPLGFAAGLLSFQNGFFWKTMLARQSSAIGEEKASS